MKKNPGTISRNIQWEVHFFTFLNTDKNAKKKIEFKYGPSHLKSDFKIGKGSN